MDIISLGKANSVLKKIKEIDEVILSKEAEGRFLTVKERLDWLEAQSSQLVTQIVKIVDLAKGTLNNVEIVEGKLKLKQVSVGRFVKKGTFDSPVIDLGDGFKSLKQYTFAQSVTAGKTTSVLEVSTSSDGTTFSQYAPIDKQASRFIKLRVTLEATPLAAEVNAFEFNQAAGNLMTVNPYVEVTGDAKLKKVYDYPSVDGTVQADGKYISTLVPASSFKTVMKVQVT